MDPDQDAQDRLQPSCDQALGERGPSSGCLCRGTFFSVRRRGGGEKNISSELLGLVVVREALRVGSCALEEGGLGGRWWLLGDWEWKRGRL